MNTIILKKKLIRVEKRFSIVKINYKNNIERV